MTDELDTTAQGGEEAPAGEAPAAAPSNPDELANLTSRNKGLNAKVTELQKKLEAEVAARTAAEQAAIDKAGSDEPLKKRIAELEAKLEAGEKAAALAAKGAQYPEAFSELGEDIANMSTEKLAALEARLKAAKDEGEEELPKPIGVSQKRTTGGTKAIEDMTSAELQAFIKAQDPSIMGLNR